MMEDLLLAQLLQLNLLNKDGIHIILRLIHHKLLIVQLDSKMTLNLLSNPQILDFINSKRVFQNLSQMELKAQRKKKIEIFLQNLEAGLKFQGLRLKEKVGQIGEIKICLKINK